MLKDILFSFSYETVEISYADRLKNRNPGSDMTGKYLHLLILTLCTENLNFVINKWG